MRNKKVLLSAALVVSAVSSALAQGNGLAGINDATNMVTSYFDPGTEGPHLRHRSRSRTDRWNQGL